MGRGEKREEPPLGVIWGWVAAGLSRIPAPPPRSHVHLSLGFSNNQVAECYSERTDGELPALQRLSGCVFPSPLILQAKQAATGQCGGNLLNEGQASLEVGTPFFGPLQAEEQQVRPR